MKGQLYTLENPPVGNEFKFIQVTSIAVDPLHSKVVGGQFVIVDGYLLPIPASGKFKNSKIDLEFRITRSFVKAEPILRHNGNDYKLLGAEGFSLDLFNGLPVRINREFPTKEDFEAQLAMIGRLDDDTQIKNVNADSRVEREKKGKALAAPTIAIVGGFMMMILGALLLGLRNPQGDHYLNMIARSLPSEFAILLICIGALVAFLAGIIYAMRT